MKRQRAILGAMAVATAILALSACGSSSTTAAHPSPSPSLAALPDALMVVEVRKSNANPPAMTLELVDAHGQVVNSSSFDGPPSPLIRGCVSVAPPAARIAAGAVFFADSSGAIWRLEKSGAATQVAHFPATPTTFLSWAVSPDGKQFIAILLSTPPLLNPAPQPPLDPFVASGHWTLDLYTEPAGGAPTRTLHKDFGHVLASPGPTMIAGWDDGGPIATLGSYVCVQNPLPSVRYTGSSLIHLAADGTHLDTIGGGGCSVWDELHDGTVLCGGPDWASFSVRTRAGVELWTRSTGHYMRDLALSPDARAVSLNGDLVQVQFRDGGSASSIARTSQPTFTLLGWFGNDYVAALKDGTQLGLVPARTLTNFIDLHHAVAPACTDCFPAAVSLVGTLGI